MSSIFGIWGLHFSLARHFQNFLAVLKKMRKKIVGSKNRYLNNEFLQYLNTLGYYSRILYYYFVLCF